MALQRSSLSCVLMISFVQTRTQTSRLALVHVADNNSDSVFGRNKSSSGKIWEKLMPKQLYPHETWKRGKGRFLRESQLRSSWWLVQKETAYCDGMHLQSFCPGHKAFLPRKAIVDLSPTPSILISIIPLSLHGHCLEAGGTGAQRKDQVLREKHPPWKALSMDCSDSGLWLFSLISLGKIRSQTRGK